MIENGRLTNLGIAVLGISLFVVACGVIALVMFAVLPNMPQRRGESPDSLYTAAAETIMADVALGSTGTAAAGSTQTAQGTLVPTQAPPLFPTVTSPLTSPTPSVTFSLPTSPAFPTATWYFPTSTKPAPPPPPPPPPQPCDWAQFVKDVSVPDGTIFMPNSNFTKVWRLKNIGSCTWSASYALVFVSGDKMSGRNVVPLPAVVRPGQTIDLGVDLVAPMQAGKFRGNWMLSNQAGQTFGIGANANKPFWVDIQVRAVSSPYAYDFALNMCAATWRSSASKLPCPGVANSPDGFVRLLFDPKLETGRQENEQTILARPEQVRNGMIQGKFPFYRVQNGDHFLSQVGCLFNSPGCDVTFLLKYQVQNDAVKDLGAWREVYDGTMTHVDIDLSFLAGQQVSFILSVINNGKPSDANAVWFVPSIRHGPSGPWWKDLRAVQVAQQFIAMQLSVPPEQVVVTHVEEVVWIDTCLGIPQPAPTVCNPALIPGYRILMTYGSRQFEVHTDLNGDTIFWLEL